PRWVGDPMSMSPLRGDAVAKVHVPGGFPMLTTAPQPTPAGPRDRPIETADQPIRVLLVDDHPAVRRGARELIDDQPDMRVAAQARSVDEALGKLELGIDVAIVDYHLGDGRDGLWLAAHLKTLEPAPRVLIYSAFADGALAITALIAGADGLLGKEALGEALCGAVRALARGQHHLPAVTPPLAQALRSQLAPSDQPIFGMLLHGIAPELIAERLGITERELHARRLSMLRSLGTARGIPGPPTRARTPLDYERPARRPSHRTA
ncbi:MAG: response regulator, partial [Trebonia sp.]